MKTVSHIPVELETLSTRDAAARLKVSVRAVQLWVAQGRLDAWKTPGGHRRIFKASVDAMCASAGAVAITEPTTTITLLVVNDESLYASLERYFATTAGFRPRIQFVQSSLESLIKIGQESPDVLITDVNMPDVDGVALLRLLAGSNQTGRMKVIVCTRLTQQQLDALGGLPPMIECHPKPIVINDLVASINVHREQQGRNVHRSKS